ncbi:MAG TPA: cytochrome c [Xanthobacteraceae bacterium]|nr:cytochrome c [Xanthobacteraceae bacterium]
MRLLALIGALAIVGAVGAAVFFFGGFFNVAATEADPGIVNWALIKVRAASITRHAGVTPSVNLDDPAIVQAGAKIYATQGCVFCHGAPGAEWKKFSEGLNPDPPDLTEVSKAREPSQLFFVVKNGIKMTGMPSFQKAGLEDKEIWSIVAFVKKLPTVSEEDFKKWSAAQ